MSDASEEIETAESGSIERDVAEIACIQYLDELQNPSRNAKHSEDGENEQVFHKWKCRSKVKENRTCIKYKKGHLGNVSVKADHIG